MTGGETKQEPVPAVEDCESSVPGRGVNEEDDGNFLRGLLYSASFAVLIWCAIIVLIKVLVVVTG